MRGRTRRVAAGVAALFVSCAITVVIVPLLQQLVFDVRCRVIANAYVWVDSSLHRTCSHDPPHPNPIDVIGIGWMDRPSPLWAYDVHWL